MQAFLGHQRPDFDFPLVIAIADHGSLRSAAQHLGLAQPALTRSIRQLERELKADLFERHARGMALTAYGEVFILGREAWTGPAMLLQNQCKEIKYDIFNGANRLRQRRSRRTH